MKKFTGLILALFLAGCAVCSKSDNAEQCRTKQRDHSQPRIDLAAAMIDVGMRILTDY
jgi:PBP1b-binding outer membrane lipoprotein LpoB